MDQKAIDEAAVTDLLKSMPFGIAYLAFLCFAVFGFIQFVKMILMH